MVHELPLDRTDLAIVTPKLSRPVRCLAMRQHQRHGGVFTVNRRANGDRDRRAIGDHPRVIYCRLRLRRAMRRKMTTVETIGRIRRAYFVQRQSVREIARRLHVSRKTVRKAIEAEDGKFSYDPHGSADAQAGCPRGRARAVTGGCTRAGDQGETAAKRRTKPGHEERRVPR